jgi:large subunit ribosomal protein L27e
MGKKTQERRTKIKPFIKVINYNHLMPTRYTLELDALKGVISADTFKEQGSKREDAKKTVKKLLEERHRSGKNRWFFSPLRMLCPLYSILSSCACLSARHMFYVFSRKVCVFD